MNQLIPLSAHGAPALIAGAVEREPGDEALHLGLGATIFISPSRI